MDKCQKAIIHLLQGEGVFYASLLMQMQRVDGSDLPKDALAAVSVQNGRIKLHIDPSRLEKLDIGDVSRIMEHECLHLVMEHIGRRGIRDPYVWNIATDLAVNSLIPGMKMGLNPGVEPFTNFPKGKAAEFYYAMLQNKIKNMTMSFNPDGSVTVTDDKTGESETYHPTGDHQEWAKSGGGEGSITKEAIKQAVAEAKKAVQKARGQWPAGVQELVDELLGKNVVDWKKLLKQYVGNAVKSDSHYTWRRCSKRYGDDQKGKARSRILDIALAIDTSGSVSSEELQEVMVEIQGLMRSYKTSVTILECDAAVQKVYTLKKYQKVDPKFKGRGGTDFRPVFTYFDEKKKKPGLLIFFTDLEGPFPDKQTMRTLWVRTSTSRVETVPFGRLICLPPKEDAKRW